MHLQCTHKELSQERSRLEYYLNPKYLIFSTDFDLGVDWYRLVARIFEGMGL